MFFTFVLCVSKAMGQTEQRLRRLKGGWVNKRSNWIRIGLWQGMVDEKLIDFDLLLNQKKEIDNFIAESAFLSV